MKAKYIGLFAVILIFGIIFVPKIHDRIVNNTVVDNTRMSTAKSQQADVIVDTSETLLELQEVPDFDFINQNNEDITNDFYKGKVYVVEFFFSSCTTICPIMNRNMVQVSQEFTTQENFGIASISIDPSFDTPEVLKAYATRYNATHPNWNFLTADQETIHKLSNEGFKLFAAQDKDVRNPNQSVVQGVVLPASNPRVLRVQHDHAVSSRTAVRLGSRRIEQAWQ